MDGCDLYPLDVRHFLRYRFIYTGPDQMEPPRKITGMNYSPDTIDCYVLCFLKTWRALIRENSHRCIHLSPVCTGPADYRQWDISFWPMNVCQKHPTNEIQKKCISFGEHYQIGFFYREGQLKMSTMGRTGIGGRWIVSHCLFLPLSEAWHSALVPL